MTADAPASPDGTDLEARLVAELRAAVDVIVAAHGDDPLAAIVLWADPDKGWYEVHVDTAARNQAGARARNARPAALIRRSPRNRRPRRSIPGHVDGEGDPATLGPALGRGAAARLVLR